LPIHHFPHCCVRRAASARRDDDDSKVIPMRFNFVASVNSIFLAAALLAGCAGAPAGDESVASVADAIVSSELAGTYRPADGSQFPFLTLADDGTYVYDTGIRCIMAPCPSGDSGTWRRGPGATIRLVAETPEALEPRRSVQIVSSEEPVALRFVGPDGATLELSKEVAAVEAPNKCAVVRCGGGARCEVVEGQARCVADDRAAEEANKCAVVRCGGGARCEVVEGQARCVAEEPAAEEVNKCAVVRCGGGARCEVVEGQARCVL
jgi:hypothetical protein